MSSNSDTSRFEQLADEHDANLDALASLGDRDRLERELGKVPALESRGLEDRAEAIEREVLAEVEAAAESAPDAGAGGGRSAAKEIHLPENVSVAEAENLIQEADNVEDPRVVAGDALDQAKATLADALGADNRQEVKSIAEQDLDTLAFAAGFSGGLDGASSSGTSPDTMTQKVESRSGGSYSADTGGGFDPSGLSLSDRDALRQKRRKIATFDARDVSRADTLRAEAAEQAGVDDYDDIDWDAL